MFKSRPFWIVLSLLVLLPVAWFTLMLSWSYSSGERAGYVQKLSYKGWVCKTWEGELALVSMPGTASEIFHFTVHNDAVAQRIEQAMGQRVALHYEEKKGLATSCFGDTRYFVTDLRIAEPMPAAAPQPAPLPPLGASAASAP